MSDPFSRFTNTEVRGLCKERIETLEHWLRRLVDEALTTRYGDYFSHADEAGNRVIRLSLSKDVDERRAKEPSRYPRKIDAVLLGDLIDLICHPKFFREHFAKPLRHAFPDGAAEVRTFLGRLVDPRNRLAHANSVSLRSAEQVLCYTNDVLESLKKHYQDEGMQQDYNVPEILRFTDSFGTTFHRSQFLPIHSGGNYLNFANDNARHLRPGDVLTLEVEVDPSFDSSEYSIKWTTPSLGAGFETEIRNRLTIVITNREVSESFQIACYVRTHREWHRYPNELDDFLGVLYKGLPPIR
jgi:hypothetical protein